MNDLKKRLTHLPRHKPPQSGLLFLLVGVQKYIFRNCVTGFGGYHYKFVHKFSFYS